MGTRSTTHFHDYGSTSADAIIYRHWDGHPEYAGADILRYLDAVADQTSDTRFGDATMLAARYVAYLGERFTWQYDHEQGEHVQQPPLSFLSVRVLMDDPYDLEYRYHVYCDGDPLGRTRPRVTVQERVGSWDILDFGPEVPLDVAIANAKAAA